jgi:hypothetical protein
MAISGVTPMRTAISTERVPIFAGIMPFWLAMIAAVPILFAIRGIALLLPDTIFGR